MKIQKAEVPEKPVDTEAATGEKGKDKAPSNRQISIMKPSSAEQFIKTKAAGIITPEEQTETSDATKIPEKDAKKEEPAAKKTLA